MSRLAILSIKPEFAHRIFDRTKNIELRRTQMGIKSGDVLLIYTSAPEQSISGWFRVSRVEVRSVGEMWKKYHSRLGIGQAEYLAYFEGVKEAVGLHIGEVQCLEPVIFLNDIQMLVDGFFPPQGIIRIKSEFGRYGKLLTKIRAKLPEDILPQLSLFKETHVANRL